MAKGLASGFPLSAIATRAELSDQQDPGMMGGTYAGNAVACAAALATQQVIREEGLMVNALEMGSYLTCKLKEVQATYPVIRDVRGPGHGGGDHGAGLRPAHPALHARAPQGRAADRPGGGHARGDRGRAAGHEPPAAGLPLLAALRVRLEAEPVVR